MPDQVELVAGEQPLVDEHLVEGGTDREHVVGQRKMFACSRIECDKKNRTGTQSGQ